MNNDELNEKADRICSIFFSKENQTKTNNELMDLIKPILLRIAENGRALGRLQILNHIEMTCKDLRSDTKRDDS